MDVEDEAYAMSQCSYSFGDSGEYLTVHVRRSGPTSGESRQADADEIRARDDDEMNVEYADAIASGEDIEGLGRLAYKYSLWGDQHVVAYRNDGAYVWSWMYNESKNLDEVLRIQKAVAEFVMSQL